LMADDTYLRLDGRYFGRVSGSFSLPSTVTRDVDVAFFVLDQHDWDIKLGHSTGSIDEVLTGHSIHGELQEFSASLPASEAYYLYLADVTPVPNQTYLQGYDPVIRIEVHWHIWGPTIGYGEAYTALFLLGSVFVLFADYAGLKLVMVGKKKGA